MPILSYTNIRITSAIYRNFRFRALFAILTILFASFSLCLSNYVSKALTLQAQQGVDQLGANLFVALAGDIRFRRSGTVATKNFNMNFKEADALALKDSLPYIKAITPFAQTSDQATGPNGSYTSTIMGAYPSYFQIRALEMEYGGFFSTNDLEAARNVCVLGNTIANRLFGSPAMALNKNIRLKNSVFKVKGVVKPKGRDISGIDQDDFIFMPLSTFLNKISNQDFVEGAFMTVLDGFDPEHIKSSAAGILRRQHKIRTGEKDDFSLVFSQDAIETKTQVIDLVSNLGYVAAGISFLVGGMGIFSLLTLLIRFRQKEIGIRRTYGATGNSIRAQLLFEAFFMSLTGSILGTMIAWTAFYFGSPYLKLPYFDNTDYLLITVALSSSIGLVSGIYPARKAASHEILDLVKA